MSGLIGHFFVPLPAEEPDCNTATLSPKNGCPAKHRGNLSGDSNGNTMKTRMQTLVVSFIAISLMTSMTAQAGVLDWFRSHDAKAERASEGTFDQLYASIARPALTNEEKPSLIAHAIAPANSPVGGIKKVFRKNYLVELSAYTSEVEQTDASPFITANGSHVRDGIVATNMFPFGTAIKIPSLYGDKIFVVEDRMNTRYQKNVDIWFSDKTAALKLGRRLVQIEVIR